jgi:hypothetical protein
VSTGALSLPNGYGVTSVQQAPEGGLDEPCGGGVVAVRVLAQSGAAAATDAAGPAENNTDPATTSAASIAVPAVRGVPPSLLISTPHRTGRTVTHELSSRTSNNSPAGSKLTYAILKRGALPSNTSHHEYIAFTPFTYDLRSGRCP